MKALQIPQRSLKISHFCSLHKEGFGRKAVRLHLEVSDAQKVYVEPAPGNGDALLLCWNKIPGTGKMGGCSDERDRGVR